MNDKKITLKSELTRLRTKYYDKYIKELESTVNQNVKYLEYLKEIISDISAIIRICENRNRY